VAFWENPEFIRHLRAELRGPRSIIMAVLTVVVSALVGLSCWGAADNSAEFFRLFHYWLIGIEFVVLGLWCASACGQAISRERELKTYDFLRTTRLTAWELAAGKILGAPVMAYFVVGCSAPIAVVAGLLAGISAAATLGIYVLLVAFALFVSVIALWISMLMEKSSAAVALLVVLLPMGMGNAFAYGPFAGFSAISVFPAIMVLYHPEKLNPALAPTLLGFPVPLLALTLILYATLGAWFALMLVRNLKKDREEIRLLSRWQAVGFVAYLNVLFYAFLNPQKLGTGSPWGMGPQQVSVLAMTLNAVAVFFVGVGILTPRERLKVWWRHRVAGQAGYLAPDGMVWPWLVMAAAVAYALLAAEAFGMQGAIPLDRWRLGTAAILLLNYLVFVTRDILFLQWAMLTRMKRPVIKGFLYLWLYYAAAGVVSSVVGLASEQAGTIILGLTTPFLITRTGSVALTAAHASYAGMGLQIVVAMFLGTLIARRLSHPPVVPETSTA
jgi:hypothetical protein